MRPLALAALVAISVHAGCGGDDTAAPPDPPDAGPPAPEACQPGELTLESGLCQAAGIDPTACATGFVADAARGCSPVLPEAPCDKGQMAVPGDTACREIAPCAPGRWGDAPIDGDTQFVDVSFTCRRRCLTSAGCCRSSGDRSSLCRPRLH